MLVLIMSGNSELVMMNTFQRCQALCRDGTKCLNRAKYRGYCWKHQEIKGMEQTQVLLLS